MYDVVFKVRSTSRKSHATAYGARTTSATGNRFWNRAALDESGSLPRRASLGWVLVSDGGFGQGRSALAAVRALARAGYRVAVTVSGPRCWSLAAASRDAARVFPVPPANSDGYVEAVRAAHAETSFVAMLPASDVALIALGLPGAALVDKREILWRAAAAGLDPLPVSVHEDAAALMGAAGDLPYPLVVKPAVSSFPATFARRPADLRSLWGRRGPFLVQPFSAEPLCAIAGVIQGGRLVAVVHQRYVRTWPVPCGTACAAETVPPDVDLEERVIAMLDGYEGIFQVQLAGRHPLDFNLRVYGSMPLAVAAGVNLAALACDVARGSPLELRRARVGVRYRWLEGDLRHVSNGVRSGRLSVTDALRALRPRSRSAHSVESLRDPWPMIARARYALRRRR